MLNPIADPNKYLIPFYDRAKTPYYIYDVYGLNITCDNCKMFFNLDIALNMNESVIDLYLCHPLYEGYDTFTIFCDENAIKEHIDSL